MFDLIWIPALGLLGMVIALLIYLKVLTYPQGNEKMQEIGEEVRKGAMVFLKREYSIIFIFMVAMFLVLSAFISIYTAFAFVCGAVCSLAAGFFGLQASTRSGNRACQGAVEGGASKALLIAFLGGSVMGISVAALGVIGLGLFFIFTQNSVIINGFAMGASSVALFARVGGGIYTKSADVGADLVGKLEAGIPEDDPRNPGVIADNVGDNVGDTAGMGADLFESYVGSVVAAIAIGSTGAVFASAFQLMLYPIILITLGLLASLAGIFSMNIFKRINPQTALRSSTYVAGLIFIIGAYFVSLNMLGRVNEFWAVITGLFCGVLIGVESEYFTSGRPVREIAQNAQSGAAPAIISGLASGFKSTILPILTLGAAVLLAYKFSGLYGIALSGVGMLATIGIVMSTDSYGPIADNAGGCAEMAGLGDSVRKVTDKLDSLGNTTAAIGKGFAIGSAALTALALFAAFQQAVGLKVIDLASPLTVVGLFIGAAMPLLIAALTMEAVGRAAYKMVNEIRRQFREIKGLMEGTAKPDTAKCVDIATKGALREMILPGISALIVPIAVGLLLGMQALGGFLAGATVSGVLFGIFMSNAGGAFDNAKKWIEEGNLGGKGTPTHAAAVVGDTLGDPMKDTSGPAMNILIKLMAVVSLVFAPMFVVYTPIVTEFLRSLFLREGEGNKRVEGELEGFYESLNIIWFPATEVFYR
ncbi:MAG: sodium-translocating pyrophosphatase [Candidatus Saganbacteria bacterium]|nr:sodium-translocating pyrophosphatase [Candidatus Saganbacteria bacterium]